MATFFDGTDYLRLWEMRSQTPDKTEREAASLWAVLGLSSREDIVQVKLILTDMADFRAVDQAYAQSRREEK